ncbi:MBL fold metallo-hydrolase, partial [Desulfovibrio sp. OttesenSCG-928-C14]|nr:MBL fold metallo-hydrolase [Desulfovibrio sp. OttesenSCG-928-C14]
FVIGPLSTNCYLVHNYKEAALFDPGGEVGEILQFLKSNSLKLTHIYNTHMHFDHVWGNQELSEATGAPIFANERDHYLVEGNAQATRQWGLPPVKPYEYVNLDEGEISILGTPCRVLATPGHTPGSLSFYLPEHGKLFSGDLLFYRAVGRSDFPGGDGRVLAKSVREKVYVLPDETVVYAGHELATTVGGEKQHNPYVRP